jgi:uncharacterized protein YjiK
LTSIDNIDFMKGIRTVFILAMIMIEMFAACKQKAKVQSRIPYNLDQPSIVYTLPIELDEISGIVWMNDTIMACIEDNKGTIFLYNLKSEQIQSTIEFKNKGDFEDLVKVDSVFYALHSNGTLYKVDETGNAEVFKNKLSGENDVEGLCYDYQNNRLLLALKGRSYKGEKNCRQLFSFDLKTEQLSEKPVFKICLEDLEAMGNKEIEFRPSGLSIHPITGQLYMISSESSAILRMRPDGKIIDLAYLNTSIFNQPEGITFTPDGTLYISNEGKNGTADILKFLEKND